MSDREKGAERMTRLKTPYGSVYLTAKEHLALLYVVNAFKVFEKPKKEYLGEKK